MKVVQINSVSGYGSTGRIAVDISNILNSQSIENYILYGRKNSDNENSIRIGTDFNVVTHMLASRLLGKHGFYSKRATHVLVKTLKEIDPDIIHLHNIHGYYLNVEILFDYLAKSNKKLVWTLHDCWSFTGHCAYFDYVGCEKWKTQCHNCPQLKEYPKSMFFDRSKESFIDKKRIFNSVDSINFVTPSKWLKDTLAQSFLQNHPSTVINNGIDLDVFKPTTGNFRTKHNLVDKFIILGVASIWERRKGLDYFIKLSDMISDDEVIVLVGLTNKQQENLPSNIIGISRTDSIEELAELYTTSDVFVNPTLEDNFPTTNIEALACGTPVITFRTGGSPEIIDKDTGIVTDKGNLEQLYQATETIKHNGSSNYKEACLKRAKTNFDKNDTFKQYLKLYKSL